MLNGEFKGTGARLYALSLYREGKKYQDVARMTAEKFGFSERQGYYYAQAAKRYRDKIVKEAMKDFYVDMYDRFMFLYEQYLDKKVMDKEGNIYKIMDLDGARNTLKDLIKSFGLESFAPIPTNPDAAGNKIDELVFRVDSKTEEE